MKSDEKTIIALTAQTHNAEADKRTLQKKLAASEHRVQDLENRLAEQQASSDERIRSLTEQLSQEVAKVSSMMQQLVDFMMGKGAVSLSDTLRESVVAGVRDEVRKEMRQEYQSIIDEKDARIAALEAMQNHEDNGDGTESPETTIKKLEQRNKELKTASEQAKEGEGRKRGGAGQALEEGGGTCASGCPRSLHHTSPYSSPQLGRTFSPGRACGPWTAELGRPAGSAWVWVRSVYGRRRCPDALFQTLRPSTLHGGSCLAAALGAS